VEEHPARTRGAQPCDIDRERLAVRPRRAEADRMQRRARCARGFAKTLAGGRIIRTEEGFWIQDSAFTPRDASILKRAPPDVQQRLPES
jgi:hypothetical protein